LFLCFNWAPRHEGVLGEWRYSSTHSLTSALDGGEWSASLPGRFIPRERAPHTPWIGGWVGSSAFLDAVVKRKIPSPCRESNPRTPITQPVVHRYTDWAIMETHVIFAPKLVRLKFTAPLNKRSARNSDRWETASLRPSLEIKRWYITRSACKNNLRLYAVQGLPTAFFFFWSRI
jgi:hypothetical protein